MAKQKTQQDGAAAPAATEPSDTVAAPLKNVPFIEKPGVNKVLTMIHADHGEAQVGDWQVEEFAAHGWQLKD